MTKILKYVSAAALLATSPAVFACDYPERADIVSGTTASKEEMIETQKAVKAYMAAMEEYLACIATEEEEAVAELEDPDEETLQQRQMLLAKKHNAAVEEMELVAAEFNEQVRLYKGREE